MKICIISFWTSNNNYGQLFQGYALQNYLRQQGHDVYHLKYRTRKVQRPLLIQYIIKSIKFIINPYKKIKAIKANNLRYNHDEIRDFISFRNLYMNFSTIEYNGTDSLKKNPPIADYYITGSDQVWAQLISKKDNRAFYLDFGEKKTNKIAYAASFAMTQYPKELLPDLRQLLLKFKKIGVRENDGINICKNIGINAILVPDPTILFKGEDYRKLSTPISKLKKFAFIYSLNINNPQQIYWETLSPFINQKALNTVVTTADGLIPACEIFEAQYIYATPNEWLWLIDNAEFVITASFHGIIFSILMNTPFVYIPLQNVKAGMNNRVILLLKDLGLENRICYAKEQIKPILDTEINWSKVNMTINEMRETGKSFLNFQ